MQDYPYLKLEALTDTDELLMIAERAAFWVIAQDNKARGVISFEEFGQPFTAPATKFVRVDEQTGNAYTNELLYVLDQRMKELGQQPIHGQNGSALLPQDALISVIRHLLVPELGFKRSSPQPIDRDWLKKQRAFKKVQQLEKLRNNLVSQFRGENDVAVFTAQCLSTFGPDKAHVQADLQRAEKDLDAAVMEYRAIFAGQPGW